MLTQFKLWHKSLIKVLSTFISFVIYLFFKRVIKARPANWGNPAGQDEFSSTKFFFVS
jgi:hypothetical protein